MARLQNNIGSFARFALSILIFLSACNSPQSVYLPTVQPPRMSEQELNNLVAFTRLLGYIQYFHPSDQAQNTNWELFAQQGVTFVESAINNEDLVDILNNLFLPIAPTIRVFTAIDDPPPSLQIIPTAEHGTVQTVSWSHHGFGGGNKQDIYYDKLIYQPVPHVILPTGVNDPTQPYYADLGGGIAALIPLALFTDKLGTLPHQIRNERSGTLSLPSSSFDDRIVHIATVALSWNIMQHFYPYFDVTKTNWLEALKTALIGADAAKNEDEFIVVLREMMAQLHDGHGRVYTGFPPSTNIYRPPFGWDWVENQLVITFVDEEAKGKLRPGDRVVGINGQTVSKALESQRTLISGATKQWINFRSIQDLLLGSLDTTISLVIQPGNGITYEVSYERNVYVGLNPFLFTEQRPQPVSEIQPSIWYVDLTRVTDTLFTTSLPQLEDASGIVFDMRGYPFLLSAEMIGHLIDKEVLWPQLRIPIITLPDHQFLSYDKIIQSISPKFPRLTTNTVFIVDGRVMSYSESIMQTIASNNIAKIVGEPTAGTNGNIAVFTLFGKYTFQFTGMQVLNQDGSQFHGIGVQPTLVISRTLRGVRLGHDELLDGAIHQLTH